MAETVEHGVGQCRDRDDVLGKDRLAPIALARPTLDPVGASPLVLDLARINGIMWIEEFVLRLGYRGFPVVDPSGVRGLISVVELRRVPRERWAEVRVADAMTPFGESLCAGPSEPLADVLPRVALAGGRLLVMEDGQLRGMLTKDALNRFVELRRLDPAAAAEPDTSADIASSRLRSACPATRASSRCDARRCLSFVS